MTKRVDSTGFLKDYVSLCSGRSSGEIEEASGFIGSALLALSQGKKGQ